MTKNMSLVMIAAITAILISSALAVTVTTAAFAIRADQQVNQNRNGINHPGQAFVIGSNSVDIHHNGGNTGGSATGGDQGIRGGWHNEVHQ